MLNLKKNDPAVAAEVGYEFDVMLPDGTKTDAKITVRGANSPVVKNYSRKIYQELKTKEQQAKRRGKEYEMDLEEAEELSARSAAVRIMGWKGLSEEEGKEIKFSKEEAERLMQEYPFLRDQVNENSDNLYNFRTS